MEPKYCQKCNEEDIDVIPGCPLRCMSPKCAAYQPLPAVNSLNTPIFWVLGGPGAGKGTQCAKLAKKYNFAHLSTGDLLREEVESGSPRSRCLQNIMNRGGLAPTEVVLDLVKKAMLKNLCGNKGFLVDGYPREPAQSVAFEKTIAPVTGVLFFDCAKDTLLKRLRYRMTSSESPRLDDNEETIQKRLMTFEKHKDAVITHFPDKLLRIDAECDVDTIFETATRLMDPLVENCRILAQLQQELYLKFSF